MIAYENNLENVILLDKNITFLDKNTPKHAYINPHMIINHIAILFHLHVIIIFLGAFFFIGRFFVPPLVF